MRESQPRLNTDTSLATVCCNKISFLKLKKKKALGDNMSVVPNVAAHRIGSILLGRQSQFILVLNAKLMSKVCRVGLLIDE